MVSKTISGLKNIISKKNPFETSEITDNKQKTNQKS